MKVQYQMLDAAEIMAERLLKDAETGKFRIKRIRELLNLVELLDRIIGAEEQAMPLRAIGY